MSLSLILQSRLVAIVRLDDLSHALELAEALMSGGVLALEFTLTNSDSPAAIQNIRAQSGWIQQGKAAIGMGSVRTLDEAKLSIDCGSQFVVSPITSVPIIEYCKRNKVAVCPGAYTPTEIATAWEAGADIVKVFPARSLGPSYIRDVLAPMPYLKLMPTGGIDLNNVHDYLRAGSVAVGIGSQLLNATAIRNGDWSAIAATAQSYAEACRLNSAIGPTHT
jgi:2-dehydro-3-deoxyphosphogluconate aldolase / (4S)-4-hydroxy-2-oxoglutarate aldolase